MNVTLNMHFNTGFATVFGLQTTALRCKHCKETVLYGHGISRNEAMKRHFKTDHPLLNRIYN